MRHINEHGIEIVKCFEGLALKPYLCPANVWTVGYGATVGSDGVSPNAKGSRYIPCVVPAETSCRRTSTTAKTIQVNNTPTVLSRCTLP